MAPLIKLAVGIAGTALIANGAYKLARSPLLSDLGSRVAAIMVANGITDGRARWVSNSGWTWRIARLSGTADAATRARTSTAVAALDGVIRAEWDGAAQNEIAGPAATAVGDLAACQIRVDAIVASEPIDFIINTATPSRAAQRPLDAIAQTLATCPDATITVTGDTDIAGTAAINMALSAARAEAVVAALAKRGIPRAALSGRGKGGTEPLEISEGEAANARDRRMTFRITPQKVPR